MKMFKITPNLLDVAINKPEKYAELFEKLDTEGKIEYITKEQAEKEGLIQYGDNK